MVSISLDVIRSINANSNIKKNIICILDAITFISHINNLTIDITPEFIDIRQK